jgi:hypothetical protein
MVPYLEIIYLANITPHCGIGERYVHVPHEFHVLHEIDVDYGILPDFPSQLIKDLKRA